MPGALNQGYTHYELAAPVAAGEFDWKDQTTYSDGWHYDPSIDEYVQRYDELRAHLGKRNNWSETATDRQLERFTAEHVRRLNVRDGPERIVKIVPKGRVSAFPDSPLRGIAQWKLTAIKPFRIVT